MIDCSKYKKKALIGVLIFIAPYVIGYLVTITFLLSSILVVSGIVFGFPLMRPYLKCLEKNNNRLR
ncbi:MAG: hypothetical protein DSZ06_02485 [Sulfurospirillum sp.]|nr:MAG: hypothetical protein DSZ06_02485 [Sulfurospirillum sp.]